MRRTWRTGGTSRSRGTAALDADAARFTDRESLERLSTEYGAHGQSSMPGSDRWGLGDDNTQRDLEPHITPVENFYHPTNEWALPISRTNAPLYHQPSSNLSWAQGSLTSPLPLRSQMNLIGYAESEDEGNTETRRPLVSSTPGNSHQPSTRTNSSMPRGAKQLSSYETELTNAHETLGLLPSTIHKELDMHHVKSIVMEYMSTFPDDKERYRHAFKIICRHQQNTFGKAQRHSRSIASQSVASPPNREGSGSQTGSNMVERGRNAVSLAHSAPMKRPLSPKHIENNQPRKRRPFRDSSSEEDVPPAVVTSHSEQSASASEKRQFMLSSGTEKKEKEHHTLNNTSREDVRVTEPRTETVKNHSTDATTASDSLLSKGNHKHGHGSDENGKPVGPISLQEACCTDHGRERVKKALGTKTKRHDFELNEHFGFDHGSQTSSPRSMHFHTGDFFIDEESHLESKIDPMPTRKTSECKVLPNVTTQPKQPDSSVPRQPSHDHTKGGLSVSASSSAHTQASGTAKSSSKKTQSLASDLETSTDTMNKTVEGTNSTVGKTSFETRPTTTSSRIDKPSNAANKPTTTAARTVMKRVVNTPSNAFTNLLALAEGRDTQVPSKPKNNISSAARAEPKNPDSGKAARPDPAKESSTVSSSARQPSKDTSSKEETLSTLKSYHDKKIVETDQSKKNSGISKSERSASVTDNWSDQSEPGNASTLGKETNAKSTGQTIALQSTNGTAKSTQKSQFVARQPPRLSPTTDRTRSEVGISSASKRSKLSASPPTNSHEKGPSNSSTKELSTLSLAKTTSSSRKQIDVANEQPESKKPALTDTAKEPPGASNFSKLSKLTRRRNQQQKQIIVDETSQAVPSVPSAENRQKVTCSQISQRSDVPKINTPEITPVSGHTAGKSKGVNRYDFGSHETARSEKSNRTHPAEAEPSRILPESTKDACKVTHNEPPRNENPTSNAALRSFTIEPNRSNATLPIVHLRHMLPTPRDEFAEPYFEFSIFERLWSDRDDESQVVPKEPPGYLLTCVENANRQAEDYFHATLDQHCNALRLIATSTKSVRSAEDDCITFSATLTSTDVPSNPLHLQVCVKRYVVDSAAASMRPPPALTPFISKTMYMVSLYKLVEAPQRESSCGLATTSVASSVSEDSSSSSSSSDSDSDSESELSPEKTMFAKQQRQKQKQKQQEEEEENGDKPRAPTSPPAAAISYLRIPHFPLPNGRVEAYTTHDAANVAAFQVHTDMSHVKNATGANLHWQEQNLRELRLKLEGLNDDGLRGDARFWKSEFNESGLGGSKYEVSVRRIGVSGPRNV